MVFFIKNEKERREILEDEEEIWVKGSAKPKSYLVFSIIYLVLLIVFSFFLGVSKWIPLGFAITALIFASVVEYSNKKGNYESGHAFSKKVRAFIFWSITTFVIFLGVRLIFWYFFVKRLLRLIPEFLQNFFENGWIDEIFKRFFEN